MLGDLISCVARETLPILIPFSEKLVRMIDCICLWYTNVSQVEV